MSTAVMALCWPLYMPPTCKSVLISLADQANDQGVCWPSFAGICERTCFGRTAVIEALQWLEERGYMSIEKRQGANNRYLLNMSKLAQREIEPVRETNRSAKRTGTPGEPVREPDPSGRRANQSASRTAPVRQADPNRQEPSQPPDKRVVTLTVDQLMKDGLTEQTAIEWLQRRKQRRAPLTPRAWEGMKDEAAKAGWDIESAIRKALQRGWQTFDSEFVQPKPTGRQQPAGGSPVPTVDESLAEMNAIYDTPPAAKAVVEAALAQLTRAKLARSTT